MSDMPLRAPLRPLSQILPARERGENPDIIERKNIELRHETQRDPARARSGQVTGFRDYVYLYLCCDHCAYWVAICL